MSALMLLSPKPRSVQQQGLPVSGTGSRRRLRKAAKRSARRLAVVIGATLALLIPFASAAWAGTSYISNQGGSYVRVTWNFYSRSNVSLSFAVTDTVCNAKPATGKVRLYLDFLYETVEVTNYNGCNTTRYYNTGTFSVGEDIINLRVCADVYNDSYPETCGQYNDNPYT